MKNLFSTPKRAVISTICIMLILFIVIAAAAYAVMRSTVIDSDDAETAALKDAGLDKDSVSALSSKLELDDGALQYEVGFYSDGKEYEYVIQASDGDVVSCDIDQDDDRIAESAPPETTAQTTQPPAETTVPESSAPVTDTMPPETSVQTTSLPAETPQSEPAVSAQITVKEAKSAALADAGLSESQVTFTKSKHDYDDGIEVYDIEFFTADTEYEYEIKVSDGSVYGKDSEKLHGSHHESTVTSTSKSALIGEDKAKAAALSHAGLSESDVRLIRVEIDRENGRTEYEVDFKYGAKEYDYVINAETGDIIEYDIDFDD